MTMLQIVLIDLQFCNRADSYKFLPNAIAQLNLCWGENLVYNSNEPNFKSIIVDHSSNIIVSVIEYPSFIALA